MNLREKLKELHQKLSAAKQPESTWKGSLVISKWPEPKTDLMVGNDRDTWGRTLYARQSTAELELLLSAISTYHEMSKHADPLGSCVRGQCVKRPKVLEELARRAA